MSPWAFAEDAGDGIAMPVPARCFNLAGNVELKKAATRISGPVGPGGAAKSIRLRS